jgi:hypothetical protein
MFESPVVVFLGVLGIDEKNARAFHGAAAYSPALSKFVKLSQMLVIRRAVAAAEDGDVEYPADMLDDLRKRSLCRALARHLIGLTSSGRLLEELLAIRQGQVSSSGQKTARGLRIMRLA